MNHYPSSLWSATSNSAIDRPALGSELNTDVVIIGAGFTGLSAAYFLQQMGVQTIVLEQHKVGWGASGRNAGMLLTGYKPRVTSIAKRWGVADANEMLQMSLDGIRLVKEIVTNNQIECDLNHSGSMSTAFKSSHFNRFKEVHEFMQKNFNYETFIVDKNDLKEELDSVLYYGGLIDPNSYSFHPLNYALGLANAVEKLGGKIFEDSMVLSVEHKKNSVHVKTENGSILAKDIIIGTNGYTTEINRKLARSIIPIGSYIIATEPLPEQVANRLIPNNRMFSDSKKFLYYFRLTPDRRILFGGRVSFNGVENEELYHTLRENMLQVFPELEAYQVDYRWGGMVGFTKDQFPHIGQLEDGTHFAYGYCGHGASMSTLMGKLLSENVLHVNKTKSMLEKLPLQTIPFHGQRVIALNLMGSYYKFLDLIS